LCAWLLCCTGTARMLLAGASPCATSAFLTLWSADFERCCEPRQPGVERKQLLQARRCTRSRFVVAAMVAMLVGIIPELLHSACAWCAPAVPAAAATAELHTGLVHLRDRTAVYLTSSHLATHRAAQARCSASRKRTQACARMRVATVIGVNVALEVHLLSEDTVKGACFG
jgi:hypothetical protein